MPLTGRRGGHRGKPTSRAILRWLPIWALSALFVLGTVSTFLSGPVRGQPPQTITMRDIFFDTSSFSTEPGENVTFRLVNAGAIEHTFTLFAQVNAQVPVGDNAALQAYNDTNAKIVDVSLFGGQEREVQFTAPSANGTYVYVCIVPNHAVAGMHGVMNVGPRPSDGIFEIGIVQGLLIITLIGVGIFVIIYQIRSTRP